MSSDHILKEMFPNSPGMWQDEQTSRSRRDRPGPCRVPEQPAGDVRRGEPTPPVDPALREAFPNPPEMFRGESKDAAMPLQARATARKHGIPAEAVPGLVNASKAPQRQRAGWAHATRAELGAGFDQAVADARALVARFGDTDLKAVLNHSGLGSHPALVRFVAKIAASMKGR